MENKTLKRVLSFLLVIAFIFGLSGCSLKDNTEFFSQIVKYNLHRSSLNGNKFGIDIPVLTNRPKLNLKLISAKGVNT